MVISLPPSDTCLAPAFKTKNAALELILPKSVDLPCHGFCYKNSRKHLVVFALTDFKHRLLQDHTGCVDDDIDLAETFDR